MSCSTEGSERRRSPPDRPDLSNPSSRRRRGRRRQDGVAAGSAPFLPLVVVFVLAVGLCGSTSEASCSPTSIPATPTVFQNGSLLSGNGTSVTVLVGSSQLYAATRVYLVGAVDTSCNNRSHWTSLASPSGCLQLVLGTFPYPGLLGSCGFANDSSLSQLGWSTQVDQMVVEVERSVGSVAGVLNVYRLETFVMTLRFRHPASVDPTTTTLQIDTTCPQLPAPPALDPALSGLDAFGTLSVGLVTSSQYSAVSYDVTYDPESSSLCPKSFVSRSLDAAGCTLGHVLSLPLQTMLQVCWTAGVGTEVFNTYTTQICGTVESPMVPIDGTTLSVPVSSRYCIMASLRLPASEDPSPTNVALTVGADPAFRVRARVPLPSAVPALAPDLAPALRVVSVKLDARPTRADYAWEGTVGVVTSVHPKYELFSPSVVSYSPGNVLVDVSAHQAPVPVCKPDLSGPNNCVQLWAVYVRAAVGYCHLNTLVDVFFRVRCSNLTANCSLPAGDLAPVSTFSLLPESNSLCLFSSDAQSFGDSRLGTAKDAFKMGETAFFRAEAVSDSATLLQNTFLQRVTVSTSSHRVLYEAGVISDVGSKCGFTFTNFANRTTFSFQALASCIDLPTTGATTAYQVIVTADLVVQYRFSDLSELRTIGVSPAAAFTVAVTAPATDSSSSGGPAVGVPVLAGAGAGVVVLATLVVVFVLHRRRKLDRDRDEFEQSSASSLRLQRLHHVGSSSMTHSNQPSMSPPNGSGPVTRRFLQPDGQVIYQLAVPAASSPAAAAAAVHQVAYDLEYEAEDGALQQYQQQLRRQLASQGRLQVEVPPEPEDTSYSDAGNTRASPAAAAAASVPHFVRARQLQQEALYGSVGRGAGGPPPQYVPQEFEFSGRADSPVEYQYPSPSDVIVVQPSSLSHHGSPEAAPYPLVRGDSGRSLERSSQSSRSPRRPGRGSNAASSSGAKSSSPRKSGGKGRR